MQERSIFLFMTSGSSDKVYNVHLRQKDDAWVVDFENGRRGKALRSGTKTSEPIDFDKASSLFEKTAGGKIKGGYTEEESGVAFAGTEHAGDVTGFLPQLLNEVSQTEAEELGKTGRWYLQIKHDGERRGAARLGDEIICSNRRGLRVGVAQPIHDALEKMASLGLPEFELDSEDMGDHLAVFDVLSFQGKDLRDMPFEKRIEKMAELKLLATSVGVEDIIQVDTPILMTSDVDVRTQILLKRKENEEGIVMRRADSTVTAGRPASGGTVLKLKFWESATVRVAGKSETKRSIALEILDDQAWVGVGNCTIPSNHEIPEQGALVEIEYLYAYKGGSLFQPKYRGKRTDIIESEVHIGQLKFYEGK